MFRTEKTSTKMMEPSGRERERKKITSTCTHQCLIFKWERWTRISYRIRQGGRRALETIVERVFRTSLDSDIISYNREISRNYII